MSDEVETSFVVREPDWCRKALIVQEALNAAQAIRAAGQDWVVAKEPVARPSGQIVPGEYHTVRVSDDKVLGRVGANYQVIQNGELFEFFDAVFDRENGTYYHTGGALRGGKVVWLLAKIPGDFYVVKDDKVETYVLLASSHDGSLSLTAKPTSVRVVCANTLAWALSGQQRSVTVKHTTNYEAQLREAHKVIGLASRNVAVWEQVAKDMAARQLHTYEVRDFMNKLFPTTKDKVPAVTQKRREAVYELFGAETNTLAGMKNTAWGLYNAVVEYADYAMPSRKGTDTVYRAWFGSAEALKLRAQRLLL